MILHIKDRTVDHSLYVKYLLETTLELTHFRFHIIYSTQIIYGAAGMAAGNQIELGNLILVVVVVVCSYGLALILAVNEFVNSLWIITELKLMHPAVCR